MDRLRNNLLQRVPIQELVIPLTINSELLFATLQEIKQYNGHYVKIFLDKLFRESDIDLDEFYDLFAELMMSRPKSATDEDLIIYNINDKMIKINETPRLISGNGTTGLRTWEAAIYLSNYLVNLDLKDKNVLELGSGTGLVSLSLIKNENFNNLIITDGDSNLIEQLNKNFKSNGIQLPIDNIKCQSLWWGQDEFPDNVNTVIAADVTYDAEIIPNLVQCLKEGLAASVEECLIAATIRNEDTIKVFEEEITKNGLNFQIASQVVKPSQLENSWYSQLSPEIRIYRVF